MFILTMNSLSTNVIWWYWYTMMIVKASVKNAERYVDRKFVHDNITHDFWDWLYTGSFIFRVLPTELLATPEDDVSIQSLILAQ